MKQSNMDLRIQNVTGSGIAYFRHNTVERIYYSALLGTQYTGVCFYWNHNPLVIEVDFFPLPRYNVVSRTCTWKDILDDETISTIEMYDLRSFYEPEHDTVSQAFLSKVQTLSNRSIPMQARYWTHVFRDHQNPSSAIIQAVKECLDAFISSLLAEGTLQPFGIKKNKEEIDKETLPLFHIEGVFSGSRKIFLNTKRYSDELCRCRLQEISFAAMAQDMDLLIKGGFPEESSSSVDTTKHLHVLAREISSIDSAMNRGDIPFVDIATISRELAAINSNVPIITPNGTYPAIIGSANSGKNIPLVLSSGRKIVVTSKCPVITGLSPTELREIIIALDALVDDSRFDDVRVEITRMLARS